MLNRHGFTQRCAGKSRFFIPWRSVLDRHRALAREFCHRRVEVGPVVQWRASDFAVLRWSVAPARAAVAPASLIQSRVLVPAGDRTLWFMGCPGATGFSIIHLMVGLSQSGAPGPGRHPGLFTHHLQLWIQFVTFSSDYSRKSDAHDISKVRSSFGPCRCDAPSRPKPLHVKLGDRASLEMFRSERPTPPKEAS